MEGKKTEQNTDLPVKLVIKRKGFEISTEGTIANITPALASISEFLDKLATEFDIEIEISDEESASLPTAEEVATTTSSDAPVIKVTRSTAENVSSLFNTPWGRSPHFLGEVIKALEVNAVYDTPQAVNTSLTRLVQRGVLRRIQREGKWAYVRTAGE